LIRRGTGGAELRLAVAQDAVGIGDVARRTWKDTYGGISLPQNQERFLAQWYAPAALQEALARSGSWFYVAVVKGAVVAHLRPVHCPREREGR
jgi:hypothetical protein